MGKTAVSDLTEYANTTETALTNYFEIAGRYMIFPDIYHDATALVWNPFEVVSSARNLSAEINSLQQQDVNVPLYVKSNKFMAELTPAHRVASGRWINEKQQCTKKRREYEAAPVYPKVASDALTANPCDFSLIHRSASSSFSNPKTVSTFPPRHSTLTECPFPILYYRTRAFGVAIDQALRLDV